MPEIRDIGTIITQVLVDNAAAPAAPELRQVVAGVNKQVVTRTKAGTYDNEDVDVPLVGLLDTSTVDVDEAPGSVHVFISNPFGTFELNYNAVPTADLTSFALADSNEAVSLPAYLRVTRTSQAIKTTGALTMSQGTIKQATMAGPVDATVVGTNVTITGAAFGSVVSGDILELVDGTAGDAVRVFRIEGDIDADTVNLESINPDGLGNLVTNSSQYTNLIVYTPVYTFTDANAKFLSNATRPIDDALDAGEKTYPQPTDDDLEDQTTFSGLYAYVVLKPLNQDPDVTPVHLKILTWTSESVLKLDPTNASVSPATLLGTSLRYQVDTEEPATGRIPGATADVLQSYSALRTDHLGEVVSVDGPADALEKFGPATPENPLGLAVFLAASGTPAITVYAAQATEDSLEGHAQALDAIARSDAYFLCPVSSQKAVVDAYVAQAEQLSLPDERLPRICLFNLPTPLRTTAVDLGDDVTVTVDAGSPNVVTIAGAQFQTNGVVPGFFLSLKDPDSADEDTVRRFFISHVVSESTIELPDINPDELGDLISGVKNAVKVVSEDYSTSERVASLVALAQGYASRRTIFISPDTIEMNVDGEDITVDGSYWAALIGSMYATREPGTPISTVAVPFVASISGSSDTYSNSQMRELTSNGVFLIIQTTPQAVPTVRHQVTTDTSTKATQEPSFTICCDSLDLGLKSVINPTLGKQNITKEYLNALNFQIDGFFAYHKNNRQRINSYKILEIGQSTIEGFEDSVAIRVEINVPKVANNADVTFLLS